MVVVGVQVVGEALGNGTREPAGAFYKQGGLLVVEVDLDLRALVREAVPADGVLRCVRLLQHLDALESLQGTVSCSGVGVSFALARLKTEKGIVARASTVHKALRELDPDGHKKRAKEAAKTQYSYNVAGPRSLYHADAHEKVAKIWGFWFHLLIDGYSRYIIYLTVATDKLADTVRAIFVEACNTVGWAARVRWDKGTENAGCIIEQLSHHQRAGLEKWRGSALTGRSMQNCRAEYIWNFVKRHVSQPCAPAAGT